MLNILLAVKEYLPLQTEMTAAGIAWQRPVAAWTGLTLPNLAGAGYYGNYIVKLYSCKKNIEIAVPF